MLCASLLCASQMTAQIKPPDYVTGVILSLLAQSTPAGNAAPLNIVDFLPRQTPNPALPTLLNNPALGEPLSPISEQGATASERRFSRNLHLSLMFCELIICTWFPDRMEVYVNKLCPQGS